VLCPQRLHVGGERLSGQLSQFLDLVWSESGPVVLVGDDHGSLQVAQCLDAVQRFGVGRDIYRLVGNGFLSQCPARLRRTARILAWCTR